MDWLFRFMAHFHLLTAFFDPSLEREKISGLHINRRKFCENEGKKVEKV